MIVIFPVPSLRPLRAATGRVVRRYVGWPSTVARRAAIWAERSRGRFLLALEPCGDGDLRRAAIRRRLCERTYADPGAFHGSRRVSSPRSCKGSRGSHGLVVTCFAARYGCWVYRDSPRRVDSAFERDLGRSDPQSVTVLRVLALGLPFMFLNPFLAMHLRAAGRVSRAGFRINLLALFVNVVATVLVIRVFGVNAVAFVTVLTEAVATVVAIFAVRRTWRVH